MTGTIPLRGYAALFCVRGNARINDHLPYIVQAGAFHISAAATPMIFGHNRGTVYATTARKSLRLWQDRRGLAFEADVPLTDHGMALFMGTRNGSYDQMSVEFCGETVSYSILNGERTKVVESATVGEISVCPEGACEATAIWFAHAPVHDLPARMRPLASAWAIGQTEPHRRVAPESALMRQVAMPAARVSPPHVHNRTVKPQQSFAGEVPARVKDALKALESVPTNSRLVRSLIR